MQLCSPALPVGAYAYSQGLECAVERGWVRDEASAGDWILGLLQQNLQRLDLPIFVRLYQGWQAAHADEVRRWNARLYASREAAELQREDAQLGAALARLLTDLGMAEATLWRGASRGCFATLFSLAAVKWAIPLPVATTGLGWTWIENQVTAATRLVPLGQTASQRLLVAENDGAERAPVQPAVVSEDARTKSLRELRRQCHSWLHEIAIDEIGVEHDRTMFSQALRDGALAAGDRAGDADDERLRHGTFWATRASIWADVSSHFA